MREKVRARANAERLDFSRIKDAAPAHKQVNQTRNS
jgi:hypothetical protein